MAHPCSVSVSRRRPDTLGSWLLYWVVCVGAGSIGWWVSDGDEFGFELFLTLAVGVTIGLDVAWLLSRRRRAGTTDTRPNAR